MKEAIKVRSVLRRYEQRPVDCSKPKFLKCTVLDFTDTMAQNTPYVLDFTDTKAQNTQSVLIHMPIA